MGSKGEGATLPDYVGLLSLFFRLQGKHIAEYINFKCLIDLFKVVYKTVKIKRPKPISEVGYF